MIQIDSNCSYIQLPKTDRNKLDKDNLYYLILHNNYTKDVWLFKVKDLKPNDYQLWTAGDIHTNDIRFLFKLEIPQEFEQGEYTYYLVSYDDWEICDLDTNFPQKSVITIPDKSILSYNGMHIIANNRLLVTNQFKAMAVSNGIAGVFESPGTRIVANNYSDDTSAYGEITKNIKILNTGLLKYHLHNTVCDEYLQYDGGEQDNYIQYKG